MWSFLAFGLSLLLPFIFWFLGSSHSIPYWIVCVCVSCSTNSIFQCIVHKTPSKHCCKNQLKSIYLKNSYVLQHYVENGNYGLIAGMPPNRQIFRLILLNILVLYASACLCKLCCVKCRQYQFTMHVKWLLNVLQWKCEKFRKLFLAFDNSHFFTWWCFIWMSTGKPSSTSFICATIHFAYHVCTYRYYLGCFKISACTSSQWRLVTDLMRFSHNFVQILRNYCTRRIRTSDPFYLQIDERTNKRTCSYKKKCSLTVNWQFFFSFTVDSMCLTFLTCICLVNIQLAAEANKQNTSDRHNWLFDFVLFCCYLLFEKLSKMAKI